MKVRARLLATGSASGLFALAALGGACGGSTPSGFGGGTDAGIGTDHTTQPETDGPSIDGLHLGTDSGPETGKKDSSSGEAGTGTAVVYAESPDTLYSLDPLTNAITVIGPFIGDCASQPGEGSFCATDCCDVTDIALDAESNAYVTTFGAFYSLDLTTASTKFIASNSYPNSLSFVPKGTLDPTEEALVGYNGATYVRIDTTTGAITDVGGLTGGYASSGDIVSVIGGGTFLTVTGPGCSAGDCLLQVDPMTGDLIQNYGSTNHSEVYGIAFWAGSVYGFDDEGQVFSISYSSGSIVTTPIAVPSPPPGLAFWGAGSTTSAPKSQPDGGGIPIK